MKYFIVSYRWSSEYSKGWGSKCVTANVYINKKKFTEQLKEVHTNVKTVTIMAITTLTKQEYDLYNS